MDCILDQDSLRAHFGPASDTVQRKQLAYLDRHCRAFIALSPFCVLATSDGKGGVDASPRGDPPGFVKILDDNTLLLPDRPGNRRIDSFRNVIDSPGVGLLFFVPGIDETVRVNGHGRIVTEATLLEQVPAQGRIPATGLLVTVTEAFYHCAKALIRSKLWDPATRIERRSFPTLGRIIADQISGVDAEKTDEGLVVAYRDRLY